MQHLLRVFQPSPWWNTARAAKTSTRLRPNAVKHTTVRPHQRLVSGCGYVHSCATTHGIFRKYNTPDTAKVLLSTILPADLKQVMRSSVASRRDKGDITPTTMMRMVIETFLELKAKQDAPGLQTFFLDMATELGADMENAKANAEVFLNALKSGRDEGTILSAQSSLRSSLAGSYDKLFELILAQPNGMKILIDMRALLLQQITAVTAVLKSGGSEAVKAQLARLKMLEASMRAQLQDWFSIGFLDLRRITWESPAVLLEKIMAYSNSVHPMRDWQALKTRLSTNRRCFGFFHPSMPHEPLVFIEVALTNEISSKISPILQGINAVAEKDSSAAIFYAITSTQPGLAGVDLGHMLIEHVVQEIQKELPHITTFSTFSPVPTFRSWLDTKLSLSHSQSFASSAPHLSKTEEETLIQACSTIPETKAPANGIDALQLVISQPNWHTNPTFTAALQTPLTRLCATYIAKERKRDLAVDPVANFHLRNGAEFHRVCWMADTSSKRMQQSLGLMVNYLYRLDKLASNNESYLTKGTIATGESVKNLIL